MNAFRNQTLVVSPERVVRYPIRPGFVEVDDGTDADGLCSNRLDKTRDMLHERNKEITVLSYN